MTSSRTSIVCTTIFEPRFLDGYLANIDQHGRRDSVEMIVIIDRKTPATVAAACAEAARRGFTVLCPSLDEQEQFLAKFPSMRNRVPYDSDNRRNIGFLMALHRGAELLISIDDDNYCLPGSDFVGEHSIAGKMVEAEVSRSSDGWLNIGTLLTTDRPETEIFARGFPYYARRPEHPRSVDTDASKTCRVAMNAGLWLSDPDVDAISRIAIGPHVSAADPAPRFLGSRAWSPINTQNTAIPRDVISAYYYVRMGFSLGGLTIDRYGDILSGYFAQACVHARGEVIRVGSPVADHRRTPHNLFKDLYHELAGVVMLEDLLPWLATDVRLASGSYAELYADLAEQLDARADGWRGFIWDQGAGAFLRETAGHMRAWLETVRVIG